MKCTECGINEAEWEFGDDEAYCQMCWEAICDKSWWEQCAPYWQEPTMAQEVKNEMPL